eukprot:SM000064S19789  [mRNA]  locus=s64:604868:608535:+ [translate_table: standard]
MAVAITGGSGWLGRLLAEELLRRGTLALCGGAAQPPRSSPPAPRLGHGVAGRRAPPVLAARRPRRRLAATPGMVMSPAERHFGPSGRDPVRYGASTPAAAVGVRATHVAAAASRDAEAVTVAITGGSGWLGRLVAEELLRRGALGLRGKYGKSQEVPVGKLLLIDAVSPKEPLPGATYLIGDITDRAFLEEAITKDVHSIFHLAAVLSAAAEEDFSLGMKVNVSATLLLVEHCRSLGTNPRVVFTSSIAVFGPASQSADEFTEDTLPIPLSSYGAQKAMAELLISDASRKGYLDGRAVRLPTVIVRPGKPNKAASSFCSSIVREPLQGEPAVCPVSPDLPLWVQSPEVTTWNLIHAACVDIQGQSRIITLPGLTVRWTRDPAVEAIVATWPGQILSPRALALGFQVDENVEAIVLAFKQSLEAV